MTVDLIIKNGSIVTSNVTYKGNIVVDNGKIVTITGRNVASDKIIDAEGLHVLPGVIDSHVHFRDPGMTAKEDFSTGSAGAAMGGVTTVLDMPNSVPPVSNLEGFKAKFEVASTKSYVDFGLFGVLTVGNLDEIPRLAEAGVIGYKCFMGETVGKIPPPDDGEMLEQFRAIGKLGLRITVHAENNPIMQFLIRKLKGQGRTDARAHLESRPNVVEAEAIQRATFLAGDSGCKLHVCHMSSKQGVDIVWRAKSEGLPITAETCPHYLILDDSYYSKLGNLMRVNPPIKSKFDQEALWKGLMNGAVDMIASDHAPHLREEKLKDNVWESVSGFPGVEIGVSLMLTQVNQGLLSLNKYVQLSSENPAKAWLMYPTKGTITVGSDADLTIVDMKRKEIISADSLQSKAKFTPFDGFRVKGLPIHTIVRGEVVMEKRQLVAKTPGGGLVRPSNKRAANEKQ